MANPKHRTSKSKKNKRRTHWKATNPAMSVCSHCHQPKQPHIVCPNCGYYGGREVITPRVEEEK
ncbi:MAG: 50S ribosomal protein L32 [Candidatus Krumholzibacteria bacterium]|jgi:large subunit ribosomal protein L32|nr:50S ribosomal protein L32 [Candidatus Krumholzibacteria bacterium]